MKTDLHKAKDLLQQGEVVAIPTETVYGLGGWIRSHEGLKKIFATKERPFFDPLIVHVDSIEKARSLSSQWTQIHQILAQECWPGPLTLIAPKNDQVDPLITAGLDSVGLRCPNHPLTLKLLSELEGGVAAPSANKFGKTSPTSAQHVEDEFENKVHVLDGGPCEVGIESTVAGIDGNTVKIYRPGFFTAQMLKSILQKNGIHAQVVYAQSPVAPGQLQHHYMPKIPLIIVPEAFQWEKERQKVEDKLGKTFMSPIRWKQPEDPRLASRELYERLRSFDRDGYDLILISRRAFEQGEEWLGIWNRLEKAKTLKL